MSELRDLYQQVILDHKKNPRHFGKLDQCSSHAIGDNPLCGDHIELDIELLDNRINNIAFRGDGCAISTASASLMTEIALGKTTDELMLIYEAFHDMVRQEDLDAPVPILLGKLKVFAGVREFPSRVKCASLPWHTLKSALEGKHEVSTE